MKKLSLVLFCLCFIALSASAQFIINNQSGSNSTSTSTSSSTNTSPVASTSPQITDSYIAQMQYEYHNAKVLSIAGDVLNTIGGTGIVLGIIAVAAGTPNAQMAFWGFLGGGLFLSAGIPMYIVGKHKMRNRAQYVSCFSKEIDCGDFILEPSLGYTLDMLTNSNTPSVCLALKF